MSRLETAREKFYSALEHLKEIHTRKELEAQMEKIEMARKKLWEIDPDFKRVIKERQRMVATRSSNTMAPHIARTDQARAEARRARRKAEETARRK